jgi:hypothetical protein
VRQRRSSSLSGLVSSVSSASSTVSGFAMSSSCACSALTPRKSSAMPPTTITPAPIRNATTTQPRLFVAIRCPKRSGPTIPPSPVPTA